MAVLVGSLSLLDGDPTPVDTVGTSVAADRHDRAIGATGPEVSVVGEGLGPLIVSTSALEPAEGAWLQHRVTLENRGPETLRLEDTRKAEFVGDGDPPDPEMCSLDLAEGPSPSEPCGDWDLLVADELCGYGLDDGRVMFPSCRAVAKTVVLKPGEATTFTLTLRRDLPGMSLIGPGDYTFLRPVVYLPASRGETTGAAQEGRLTIVYSTLDQ